MSSRSELTLVTPKMAAQWLSNNPSNRNVLEKVVDMYARDMANGKWLVTGASIGLDESEALLDGQHRLQAIIKSGVSVWMYVTTGLDKAAQAVMDMPIRRAPADNLHMQGELNASTLVAIVRLAIAHERGITIGRSVIPLSNSEIYEWVQCNPEVREATAIAVRHSKKILCSASSVGFSCWLIWGTVGNWYEIDEFWSAASEKIGLRHGDPVIALTNRFVQDKAQHKSMPPVAVVSAIVRAWNLRRVGKTMTLVKYDSPGKGLIHIPKVVK
jgi:hypothetical protein